uniref:4-hydroxybutyrate coenzyme A transferase n=1 Tax=Lygus hesperus TaxID=30085 RepID=A0A0A9Z318_LYGHE
MSINNKAPHLDKSIPMGKFRTVALFASQPVREALAQNHSADYVPAFFSQIPGFIRNGVIPIDVSFIHVSPPDEHGFCSLGTSVECSLAALQTAKYVIAQINKQMPRTLGEGLIHYSAFDAAIEVDRLPYTNTIPPITKEDEAIGQHCASLIPDGATIQTGIGGIPNAVLNCLKNHKDLGLHTELFSDGVIP